MATQSLENNLSIPSGLDTLPRLLLHHAKVRGDKTALREKDLGLWQTWSWREVYQTVSSIAASLAELGCERGDRVAIVGDNRPNLYMSMVATQMLGAIPVPLYQDAVAEEMIFALQDAGVHIAIV